MLKILLYALPETYVVILRYFNVEGGMFFVARVGSPDAWQNTTSFLGAALCDSPQSKSLDLTDYHHNIVYN